jgi:hypothetical protein
MQSPWRLRVSPRGALAADQARGVMIDTVAAAASRSGVKRRTGMSWQCWVEEKHSHGGAEEVLRSIGAYDEVTRGWLAKLDFKGPQRAKDWPGEGPFVRAFRSLGWREAQVPPSGGFSPRSRHNRTIDGWKRFGDSNVGLEVAFNWPYEPALFRLWSASRARQDPLHCAVILCADMCWTQKGGYRLRQKHGEKCQTEFEALKNLVAEYHPILCFPILLVGIQWKRKESWTPTSPSVHHDHPRVASSSPSRHGSDSRVASVPPGSSRPQHLLWSHTHTQKSGKGLERRAGVKPAAMLAGGIRRICHAAYLLP